MPLKLIVRKSMIAKVMFDAGYQNLTLWDVDEESLCVQKSYFEDSPCVVVEYCDALIDHEDLKLYDVILDKGFMDVFHRQGHSLKAMKNISRLVRAGGLYIALSMFHRKWKRFFPQDKWISSYGYIAVPRYSRTRPTVVSYYTNIAIIVAKNIDSQSHQESNRPSSRKRCRLKREEDNLIASAANVVMQPLLSMTIDSFPMDASYF